MNIFNISVLSQAISPINIFNFPIGGKPIYEPKKYDSNEKEIVEKEILIFKDFRTLYGRSGLNLIQSMSGNLTVYLFV